MTEDSFEGVPEAFATQPVRYLDRTRNWYATLGYAPYRWAYNDDVPWTPLQKPLSESRLALVSTAAPLNPDVGDQGPGAAYNGAAKFVDVYTASTTDPPDVRISHIGYDRAHSTAEDPRTWFPVEALRDAVGADRIGELAPRFFGAPTTRSQRTTRETHAPEIAAGMKEDEVDVALLVPT